MIFIEAYTPICESEINDTRMTIGAVCVGVQFGLFPMLDSNIKDLAKCDGNIRET